MKTVYDLMKIICNTSYRTSMYHVERVPTLTTTGHMICISVDMIFGGEY